MTHEWTVIEKAADQLRSAALMKIHRNPGLAAFPANQSACEGEDPANQAVGLRFGDRGNEADIVESYAGGNRV